MSKLWRRFRLSAAQVSVAAFLGVIGVGTLLLWLPASTQAGKIALIDALFMATSATCVTGLAVLDTARELTLFGQLVLLLLIQLGGMGLMTFSTAIMLATGRRLGLLERSLMQETFAPQGQKRLSGLVLDVVRFTFVIEGVGAVLLFFCFLGERGAVEALYFAIFHAVSAFCNAGFSLYTNSLESFRDDWVVHGVISLLVVTGGLGFLVLAELKRGFGRWRWSLLSLQSKVVLSMTGVLTAGGFLCILLLEWNKGLAALPLDEKVLAAFFQSLTTRTAGFHTLPLSQLSNETLFLMIMLMFVGASPGSCGGGIKTTSFAALVVLGFSRLRGEERPQIFRRSLPQASVDRALSVAMLAFFLISFATLLLLALEGGGSNPPGRGRFLKLYFEVVSAFGTVGLSTGVTSSLSWAGKLLLIFLMFVGRLGPLLIAAAISRRQSSPYHYAQEDLMIG